MGLYDSGQNLLNSVTSADDGENNYLLYSLTAGQNYYLNFGGNADNSYKISPTLPENIASVVKNTGVLANLADLADYNVYEFTPSADGEYIITAVGTSNVKAKLYNSNYELIAASSSGDDDVSFRITGDMTEGQKYYVVVEQKNEQQTDLSYSLYVEEPFSLIAVE